MRHYFSIHNISAGFIAVLVGYTSSVVLIIQAAHAAGANSAEIGSWLLALSIGMAIISISFSLIYKMPILAVWSTPGAALLITSLSGFSLSQAIGAFMVSAALIFLSGVTGVFTRFIQRIPQEIATAMLAGVLLQFGVNAFKSITSSSLLCIAMFLSYLIGKKLFSRYAMLLVLVVGVIVTISQGSFAVNKIAWHLSKLHFITPTFSLKAIINISLPLFIVTMTSQNLPGLAMLKKFNYEPKIGPIISWTGIINFILAPFGAYALNLAAITAAICMGENADPDPSKRYLAAVYAGLFYLLAGIFGATVVVLFSAAPAALAELLAGLALLSTIASSLSVSLSDHKLHEAAIVTFLITASGITLFHIDSTLWGLIGGLITFGFNQISFTAVSNN